MNLVDTTAPSQGESLSFEFDLHHAPEKVWRALTDPALLAEWLLPVVGLELEQGAAFRFNAQPQPGWDGVVNCRLLEVEAQRKLSYAWVVGDIDTVVTFTLDRLSYSQNPPVIFAVVDFDGGGRLPIELTDVDAKDVAIGDRVEMTFRRLSTADGVHNYFWKGRPVRGVGQDSVAEGGRD